MIVMVHSYYSVTLLDESSNESLGVHNFFRSFFNTKKEQKIIWLSFKWNETQEIPIVPEAEKRQTCLQYMV